MAERIMPPTAEMFVQRAEERSSQTNWQLARLLGDFLGRAHELYELRRARKVAHVIFAEEIPPADLDSAFINRSKLKAQELRVRYKAA